MVFNRELFISELIDRFGKIAEETRQLLVIAEVKAACKKIGISKLDAGPKGAVFSFRENASIDPQKLVRFVQARPDILKLRPDFKLVYSGNWSSVTRRARGVKEVLNELENRVDQDATLKP